MKQMFLELEKRLKAKESVVLVTIVASSGSTPRGAGARMLVCREGRICGTIGGGAVEFRSEQTALEMLDTKVSDIRHFQLSPNHVADLGMICGGDVTVYFQYIDDCRNDILEFCSKVLKQFEEGNTFWLITDLTEKTDWKMGIYSKTDGLAGLEPNASAIVQQLTPQARVVTLDGRSYYTEQLLKSGKVYVFGGGHVAQELVPALARVGFRCIVLDDRERFMDPALFPCAEKVMRVDFKHIGDYIRIKESDYICIMTRGHQYDTDIQIQVLKTPSFYIGVMGSRQKMETVGKKLKAAGFTDDDIARIHSPIGLPIKAETPAEIAVSIAAELIMLRAKGTDL